MPNSNPMTKDDRKSSHRTFAAFFSKAHARVKRSEFIKNSLTLSGGVAFSQVLPFLFLLLLVRIFTAEEFGLLATTAAITSVLAILGSGKYEAGILVAGSKQEAANLAVLAMLTGLATMTLAWVACRYLLAGWLQARLPSPELGRWIWVCPLAAFLTIIFNIYNEWCVREKYFKSLSANKVVYSGAIALGKVFFGFVKTASQGLVAGDLAGRAITAAVCLTRALLKDGKAFIQVTRKEIFRCARKFKEFPAYTMPGRLLNTLGMALPMLMLAVYFTPEDVGLFSLAITLFSMPIAVISTAINDVYRQKANEEYVRNGNCIASFDKVLKTLALISAIGGLVLVWFLPSLMRIFMGSQWHMAGVYAQIITPAMILSFVAGSLNGLFVVTDHLKAFFWWQFYYALTTLLAMWIGGSLIGSLKGTLWIFCLLRSSAYLLSIFMTRRFAQGQRPAGAVQLPNSAVAGSVSGDRKSR